jgi:fluoroquinolone transport system ATP-binding protein
MTTHNMYTADELCHEVAFLHEGAIIAKDTPRNLKLAYGEKSVKVEYRVNGAGGGPAPEGQPTAGDPPAGDSSAAVEEIILFPERKEDAKKLHELLTSGRTETVHSQEATLEQIFVQMTGRALV